jgi:hypothetical protein
MNNDNQPDIIVVDEESVSILYTDCPWNIIWQEGRFFFIEWSISWEEISVTYSWSVLTYLTFSYVVWFKSISILFSLVLCVFVVKCAHKIYLMN